MTLRWCIFLGILTAMLILTVSCAGGGPGAENAIVPSAPELTAERALQEYESGHYLWYYHLIYVNPEENEIEVIPVRQVADHWNVLRFLEQGPCYKCVEIAGLSISPDYTLLLDLKITHPFPIANLTGFDVRGILMFKGSHLFPVSGLKASERDLGDGELLNADGYTTLYNAGTAGSGPGGLQGYIEGKLASSQLPNAELNGFKRYVWDDPANTRNAFYAGEEITVTYEIDPPDGPFIFGYAVDASWAPPIEKPVDDPMTDFGPEANCPEPWIIKVIDTPVGDGLTPEGGETVLTIRVDDYLGRETHAAPIVECPELFDGALTATYKEEGPGFSRWELTVENEELAGGGEYKCLISVEDSENDPTGKPWLDLTAYQIYPLEVANGCFYNEPPVAAAQTNPHPPVIWPGELLAFSDQSTDPDGDEDIVKREWDFSYDPGDGFQTESEVRNPWHEYSEQGDYQVQLRVTDSCGNTDMLDVPVTVRVAHSGWARTWGGGDREVGYGVALDGSRNAYVTGEFRGASDFDPGPEIDSHESNGSDDVFISKFDSTGRFQWARTWGGDERDVGWQVAADSSGNVYITGFFNGTVDFDPGPGIDEHVSYGGAGDRDAFLSKLDSAGSFQWALTWGGGEGSDYGNGVTVDGSDDIYVTGYFRGTVDFDPGLGTDEHSAVMNDDVFLSKFDSTGSFQWALIWGGTYSNHGHGVAVDSDDNVYVTGDYGFTVDFDPGPGTEERTAIDWWDAYLSKFDSTGAFQWVRTWGGDNWEQGSDVATDSNNNVYVTGFFWDPVDFDPGSGTDVHTSNGTRDVFLSKFDSTGSYQWARTWGGDIGDESYSVAADEYGNACVTGYFSLTVDFDPGSGTSEYTANGGADAFVSRFYPDGSFQWARTWGGTENDSGWGITVDGSDNVYVTGAFTDAAVDFDPGPEIDEHDSNGSSDAFLVKFLSNGYWEW